jgi:hypothetical protein
MPLIKESDIPSLKKDYFSEIKEGNVYRRYTIEELATKYNTTPIILEKLIKLKGWDRERLALELKNQSTDFTKADLFLEDSAKIDSKLLENSIILLERITEKLTSEEVTLLDVDSLYKITKTLSDLDSLSQSVITRINKERELVQGRLKLQGSYQEIENQEKITNLLKEIEEIENEN